MLEAAGSEHARPILSILALFYACVQPVKAAEKDCSKVSYFIGFGSTTHSGAFHDTVFMASLVLV